MRILFIHHGDHRGGAPLSMLYTMKEVRSRGYDPIVGLAVPTPELKSLYESNKFETIDMHWIRMVYFWSANPMQWWKLATYFTVARALTHYSKRAARTENVMKEYKIEIVHLNSVSLFMMVPYLLKKKSPFVWHIREHAPKPGNIIFKWITYLMKRTRNLIFLSQAEQISWLGNREKGTVVYNFIDRDKFDYSLDTGNLKSELKIASEDRLVLYLGGLKEHKGINVLLDALIKLRIKYPNIKCIMPDSIPDLTQRTGWVSTTKRVMGRKNFEDLMIDKIKKSGLEDVCIRLPFDSEAQKYFAICELVVFPAIKPHFARPVIEAAIMKKPVIVSDFPVLLEIIKPEVTGLSVVPNDAEDLADKIERILSNYRWKYELGENAYQYASATFTANAQIDKIVNMYSTYQAPKVYG